MNKMRMAVAGLSAVALTATLAACGGGGGGGASDAKAGSFEGRGPFTYVQESDNTGKIREVMEAWNTEHPDEPVELIELTSGSTAVREALVNNAQTQSSAYCVVTIDNPFVPEFAARGWVDELPQDEFPIDEMIPSVIETGMYQGHLFAMPHVTDAGVLFVRTDILAEAGITDLPETWDDMIAMWQKVKELPQYADIGGYAGQLYKYEGFTVNIQEAIQSAGGSILDEEGKPVVDSPESVEGLERLQEGLDSGFIPQEAITYMEEEGRAAFEAGRILFYRNWPYQYNLNAESLGVENFAVTNLPEMDGHPYTPSLGGWTVGLSKWCENKASALDFIKWYTSAERNQWRLENMGNAPTFAALYEDEANIEAFPYLTALHNSLNNAVPRPRAANYGDVTAAIQDNLWPVVGEGADPASALSGLQSALEPLVGN